MSTSLAQKEPQYFDVTVSVAMSELQGRTQSLKAYLERGHGVIAQYLAAMPETLVDHLAGIHFTLKCRDGLG